MVGIDFVACFELEADADKIVGRFDAGAISGRGRFRAMKASNCRFAPTSSGDLGLVQRSQQDFLLLTTVTRHTAWLATWRRQGLESHRVVFADDVIALVDDDERGSDDQSDDEGVDDRHAVFPVELIAILEKLPLGHLAWVVDCGCCVASRGWRLPWLSTRR